jgi:hypothetical protein
MFHRRSWNMDANGLDLGDTDGLYATRTLGAAMQAQSVAAGEAAVRESAGTTEKAGRTSKRRNRSGSKSWRIRGRLTATSAAVRVARY